MPEYSLESCRSVLADALKMPPGSDLSGCIDQFRQQLCDRQQDCRGDRVLKILFELAADLETYEPDPIAREIYNDRISEITAQEKIREALEALANIETIMPWLKQAK